MRQAILYLKTTVLAGAAALLLMVSLLYAGVDALDALFWMVIVFLIGYFSILATIEEKAPRMAVRRGKKKNNLQLIISHIGGKSKWKKKEDWN